MEQVTSQCPHLSSVTENTCLSLSHGSWGLLGTDPGPSISARVIQKGRPNPSPWAGHQSRPRFVAGLLELELGMAV